MAPPTTTEDYYAVLEVAQDATPEEITRSYRQLALKLHPDRNAEGGSTQAFQLLGEAYETLKDESKRRNYDHARTYRFTDVPLGQGWFKPQRTPTPRPRRRSPPPAPVDREELIRRWNQQQEKRKRETELEQEAFLQSTRSYYQQHAGEQATYSTYERTSQGAMEAYYQKQEEVRARAAQSGQQSKEDEIAQRQAFLYQQALAKAAAARQHEETEAREASLKQQEKVRAQAAEAARRRKAFARQQAEARVAAAAEADEGGDVFVETQADTSAAASDLETEVEEVAEAFNKL